MRSQWIRLHPRVEEVLGAIRAVFERVHPGPGEIDIDATGTVDELAGRVQHALRTWGSTRRPGGGNRPRWSAT